MPKLTAVAVRTLTLPEGKRDHTHYDDDLKGFGLRIRASSSKVWVFKYENGAGKTKRMTLGSVEELSAVEARQTAKTYSAEVHLGNDPAAEKAHGRVAAGQTFAVFLPRFLERQRAKQKPRSYQETERHLLVHAKPLHTHPIDAMDRRMFAAHLVGIAEKSGPGASNRVRASLSAFMNWAVREGLSERNEVLYTNKQVEAGARDHTPTDEELAAIWQALDEGANPHYRDILRLLMLLGLRRDEVGALRWSEIDPEKATITLSPARTKAKRKFVVPLSRQAVVILEAQKKRTEADGTSRDLVFGAAPGRGFQDWSGSKRDLDVVLGDSVRPWRLHDFRRAFSTTLHERLGVPPHVVEHALGHVQTGVASIYNQAQYVEERRRALQRWGDHLEALVTRKPVTAEVVALR